MGKSETHERKYPVNLKGKTVNAWNYSWLDLETALQEGAKAINTCDAFLYIVPAVNYYHNFLDHQWIYESWSPRMMQEGEMIEQSTNFIRSHVCCMERPLSEMNQPTGCTYTHLFCHAGYERETLERRKHKKHTV